MCEGACAFKPKDKYRTQCNVCCVRWVCDVVVVLIYLFRKIHAVCMEMRIVCGCFRSISIHYRIHFSKVMHLLGWVSDFSKLGYAFDDGHMSEYEVRKEKGRPKIIESIPTPNFMPDCCFSAKLHLIIIEQHKKQTVLQQISIYFGSLRTQFSVKLRFAIYFF